ncbi:hypothetical protein [Streptomyces sp. NPDC048436]|uniref:hypothetical protein n=1 Tax=Streptomyces sp. NPDC048436 TaxID=3365550 RepID=UPI00371C1DC9
MAASPAASVPKPVLTTSEAERVFEQYGRVNASADASLDISAIREVQTGVLLRESRTVYRLHRKAGAHDKAVRSARPRFVIPAVQPGTGYPRFFVVLSKRKGDEKDRASQLRYFVQKRPHGPWRATAATWALTEPLGKPPASDPSPVPTSTAKDGSVHISFRPKQLPDFRRSAAGGVQLSTTAAADRAICDAFADFLSFSPPHGHSNDNRFAKGPFTTGLVSFYNHGADKNFASTLSSRKVGTPLPVFRLTNGSALVGCTLEQTYRVAGTGPDDTVAYDEGSDIDLALADDGRDWHSVEVVSSMTVLIEVPPAEASPATVLASDGYDPSLLSASGVGVG